MVSNGPDGLPNGKNGNAEPRSDLLSEAPPLIPTDRIAKNTSYLTFALLVQKVLALVFYIVVANAVTTEANGRYLTALSVTGIFGFFIDLGFNQVLIREIAKRRELSNRYLNTVLTFKLFTSVVTYLLMVVFTLIMRYPELTRTLILVMGIEMILDSISLSLYATFRGHQQLQYEAIGTVLNKMLVFGLGVLGIRLGYDVFGVVLAIVLGSVFTLAYASVLLRRRIGWRMLVTFDPAVFRGLLRIAIPFTIAGIFITIYSYQDQVLISSPVVAGPRAASFAAWYGTAYKLATALQFIPLAVAAAIFPAMSAYYVHNKERLVRTFERAMYYLMVLVMPIAFCLFVLAEKIILSLYSTAYSASTLPLQILLLSMPFVFLNFPVGYLLNATDRQARNTLHLGIATVLNLVLNLILIPQFTFNGAAVAWAVSNVVLFTLGLVVAGRIIPYNRRFLLFTLGKTTLAAALAAGAVYAWRHAFGLPVLILESIVFYFALLYVLRGYSLHDGARMYALVRRRHTP